MHSFAIVAAAVLALSSSPASAMRVLSSQPDIAPITSRCFICPRVKSFSYGIRPWQRHDSSQVSFTPSASEAVFSCIYQQAGYLLGDIYEPLSVIGTCIYNRNGDLLRALVSADGPAFPSSKECPPQAPQDTKCSRRLKEAEARNLQQAETAPDDPIPSLELKRSACKRLLRSSTTPYLSSRAQEICSMSPEEVVKVVKESTFTSDTPASDAETSSLQLLLELQGLFGGEARRSKNNLEAKNIDFDTY